MLTYNREKLVGRAIESVLAQSFPDFEFIIVNNGSADRSGQIADEYSAKDKRVRVIHQERDNIGGGRNKGLAAALGDYIAFVDDDDWCEPDFLEFLLALITENGADVAICGASDKAFLDKIIMNAEEALMELMWRRRYNTGLPTKMFTRELAGVLHFPEEERFDDISQMHRLIASSEKIAYHGLPKYNVYRHPGCNSAWTTDHSLITASILDDYMRAYRVKTAWLCENFPGRAEAWRYFEWSFMISMIEKVDRYRLKGCEKYVSAMLGILTVNKDAFLGSKYIQDFEKQWMGMYVV